MSESDLFSNFGKRNFFVPLDDKKWIKFLEKQYNIKSIINHDCCPEIIYHFVKGNNYNDILKMEKKYFN